MAKEQHYTLPFGSLLQADLRLDLLDLEDFLYGIGDASVSYGIAFLIIEDYAVFVVSNVMIGYHDCYLEV